MTPTANHATHRLMQAAMALIAFHTASILLPPSAIADSPDAGVKRAAMSNQDTTEESDRTNNGIDITRPQNAFEMRFSDQTSSNDTSATNRAAMLIRLNSKIPLYADWRLGLLAEVPLVEETTTNFDPLSVKNELGLGDAVFQMFVVHEIKERWAVGVGARLVARCPSSEFLRQLASPTKGGAGPSVVDVKRPARGAASADLRSSVV